MSGTFKTLEKPFRLSLKDRATFARQMSALMDAGLPVVKALSVIERQIHKPGLKAELRQILAALQEGVSLSHAFQRWDNFMIGLLKAGETGGELPEVLDRLARFYEERFRLQNKVVTTLTYPLVIFLISLLVFMGMVIFILPQFAQVYARLGGELPAYTQFWMSVSDMARSPWGLGALSVVLVAGYGILENRERYMISLQKALVGIPILGDVIVQFAATRFSRTLGTLLRSCKCQRKNTEL